MKVIIIEDEEYIADNLRQAILKCRKNYVILAMLSSVEESIRYLRGHDTNNCLIFSDVSLGDGTCFDVFSKVKVQAPIIFCTAYDKYAIEAFNTNGIDYILKPITHKRLEQAIEKFEQLIFNPTFQEEKIRTISEKFSVPKNFLVNYRDKIIPYEEEAIAAFYIDNGIVYLCDFKGQAYAINKSLEDIEQELSPEFYRASRQAIINRSAVKELKKTDSRKLILILKVDILHQITISKEKISDFKKWLKAEE